MIDYIFNEDNILKIFKEYVDSTYSEHYAKDRAIQTTEYIASQLDSTEAIGAFKFNVMKYVSRYGKKAGCNEKDLLKAMHYLLMLYYLHQKNDAKLVPDLQDMKTALESIADTLRG